MDRIEHFISDEKETKTEREKRIGIEKRIEKVRSSNISFLMKKKQREREERIEKERSSNNSGLIDGCGRPFIC